MDEIIRRYEGRPTSQGHRLEVTREGHEVTIAFRHVGEYGDEYDPYVRVARIKEIDGGFIAQLVLSGRGRANRRGRLYQ